MAAAVDSRTRLLVKGGTILSMDVDVGDFAEGDILVEGAKIAAVGRDLRVDDAEVIDAASTIVMPGFVDAHRHAWQGTLRRLMPNVDNLGDYVNATHYALAKHYRPHDMYLGNLLTALSCLDAGTTTIVDASHNARSPEHSDASIDALEQAGVRALYMPGRPLAGDWAEHWPQDLGRLQAARFASNDQLVTLGMFSVPDAENWSVARRLGVRILTEFLGAGMASMLDGLAEKHMLGPDNIFNHCTDLPGAAWRILRDAGVNITVDPRSDAQFSLEDGVFAYQAAIEHGMKPGIGTDLETSYGGDMFTEMRVAFSLQRAIAQTRRHAGDVKAPAPVGVQAILEAATIDGARCAGLGAKTGSLTPGKQADLIIIRTGDVNVFPANNAAGTVVHAADRSNVDTVLVGGRVRKARGKLVDVDMAKLKRDVEESLAHLFAAGGYDPDVLATRFPPLRGDAEPAWTGQ
ncbi:MAG: amidohydrolase [Candidatus Eremiobacteraeota bacterium]|nr:amidohydrolase [Candidatus Eremiobacteraeota bacterium]